MNTYRLKALGSGPAPKTFTKPMFLAMLFRSALLALVTDEVDGRRSGLAALCIAFTFWVVSALGSALAQLGMLPCWIGAWLGCAVLAGCAGFSLHNVLSK